MIRLDSTRPAALFICLLACLLSAPSCKQGSSFDLEKDRKAEEEMISYLEQLRLKMDTPDNIYATAKKIEASNTIMTTSSVPGEQLNAAFKKANALLELGNEQAAVELFERIVSVVKDIPQSRALALPALGVAYMRLAERTNCVNHHAAEACILPIAGMGIHQDKTPAQKAIATFEQALKENPGDLDTRWLLNIAYMTTGGYPDQVPKAWLFPGLDNPGKLNVKPFTDIGPSLGMDKRNRSGGMVVDDFNNDGFLDMVSSAWGLEDPICYFKNNGDGTFSNASDESGMSRFKGGLNICHMDYNNDGWLDLFILRGGWQGQTVGLDQPNSLIRNNGDGTFTDVTKTAGIFSEHPTQTATWNDFNKDGWLDVYIGNETMLQENPHPCELYLNNKNGTFKNVAAEAGVNFNVYAKGVVSGDYDNDGWPDLFISTMGTQKILLRNLSGQGKGLKFQVTSDAAGIPKEASRTFSTWFFDYDNDGWLDIYYGNYEFERPLSYYAAKEAVKTSNDPAGKPRILHNNKGVYEDVTASMDINQVCFTMGANFGDIDNDGFLDFYLGTGNPSYQSLIPNRMYKNIGGKNFVEVTGSARVGHLQKGHGVAFADMNNDGHQDIITEIGGAYIGDAYYNSFFLNPGQSSNNWIKLSLEGVQTNKSGIGARITLKFKEGGIARQVYRELNSGGSFGCSPFRREIGIGSAGIIDEIIIEWPVSGSRQVFKNVKPNQFLKITEGKADYSTLKASPYQFKDSENKIIMCAPPKSI